jgi:hypothetical protein
MLPFKGSPWIAECTRTILCISTVVTHALHVFHGDWQQPWALTGPHDFTESILHLYSGIVLRKSRQGETCTEVDSIYF